MPILTVLFRVRVAILVVLVLGAAAGGYLTFVGRAIPQDVLILGAVSLSLAAVVALVQLRHAGLAILTALAPLAGMIAAGSLARAMTAASLLTVYGVAYIVAALASGETVREVLEGGERLAGARTALSRLLLPAVLAAVAGAGLAIGWLFRDAGALGLGAAAEYSASILSALLFTTFGVAILPFGEGFFATANRVRERREEVLRIITGIIEPRWALSVTGIALVLAVLGWFGAAPFLAHSAMMRQPALWGASALGVFLIAYAVARDWREAFAVTLALAALTLLDVWIWTRAVGHLSFTAFVPVVLGAVAGLGPMLILVDGERRYRGAGDDAAVARLRALEALGVSPYFAVLGAGAATAPWTLVHGSIATLAAMFLLAGGAAMLVQPAIATALEQIVPRRRSLDQLYGRG